MANGFLSGLAALNAAQTAGAGLGSASLAKLSSKELKDLNDEIARIEQQKRKREISAAKREGRRGRGRLAGGGLGFLASLLFPGVGSLGTALLTGLGSYAGQKFGAGHSLTLGGIEKRKANLQKIQNRLKSGLLFNTKRTDINRQRSDINTFLSNANRQFNDAMLASTLSDALQAFMFTQNFGGELKDTLGSIKAGANFLHDTGDFKSLFDVILNNPVFGRKNYDIAANLDKLPSDYYKLIQ